MLAAIGFISLGCAVSFVLGLYFAQSLKDWVKGIPAALRADLKTAENDLVAKAKAAVDRAPTVLAPVPAPELVPLPTPLITVAPVV
jgi:hypothetical protein